ncbi:MAG: DUF438 domain-containing protein [Anaerolineaceae bacterium]|nr:DUF438 domain-containing protein [Anaerolineaceae bacterium]
MSEFINNITQRKEMLKKVLRMLHEGRSMEDVKVEFGALLEEVGADEIVEIERLLIEDGMPVEEIQGLCDVHVELFRESLDQQRTPETIPGHPLFTMRAENQILERYLHSFDEALSVYLAKHDKSSRQNLQAELERLTQFEVHYLRKENQLFSYLEKKGFEGPSKVMWGVEDEIRAMWRSLAELLAADRERNLAEVKTVGVKMAGAMRDMIYKEDKILFQAALERLSDQEWAELRAQEGEIGHFMLKPGNEWKPAVAVDEHLAELSAHTANVGGLLSLSTGALTAEQINLMLIHLPVDITFVDENDEVRFFSQTKERIFERSPAIIGRKVQNCHPPQSVDKVKKILADFKAGKRDVAEFWIQMMGMFIYIRYFALRDGDGAYRGTIEVSQNLAPLRALEGEKRLLDDAGA